MPAHELSGAVRCLGHEHGRLDCGQGHKPDNAGLRLAAGDQHGDSPGVGQGGGVAVSSDQSQLTLASWMWTWTPGWIWPARHTVQAWSGERWTIWSGESLVEASWRRIARGSISSKIGQN